MFNRENALATYGIAVGSQQSFGSIEHVGEASFSAYSDYTPVTVRSSTTRTVHAGVERDKPRD